MPKNLENIRDNILVTARKMLTDEGYSSFNIRKIANHCGIATGTIYNYYKSKQEIVLAIVVIEWQMMIRRMDTGIKMDIEQIDKFAIIYQELCQFMNEVHKIWFDISTESTKNKLKDIKPQKELLIAGLTEKIFLLINNDRQNKDFRFLADVICKLFLTYAYQSEIKFTKLRPVILSLIKG